MAIKRRDLIRSKTIIDNKIIEQTNSFKYLENLTSCEKDLDIDNKMNDFMVFLHGYNRASIISITLLSN